MLPTNNPEELRALLLEVTTEHHDLDVAIAQLMDTPPMDELLLRRLKKRKLHLKDRMAQIERLLDPDVPASRQGAGGVHHLALRTTQADYHAWARHLAESGMPNSGPVDRHWFRSLYFREPNGILIEIATDEPGFTTDETLDRLGETLSLPPFLETRRRDIEAGLKPLA